MRQSKRMAKRIDRIREKNIATCDLALLLEKRGRRQLEKSLRRLHFDATTSHGKHVRRIKQLENEHRRMLSSATVSSIERYYNTEYNSSVGRLCKETTPKSYGTRNDAPRSGISRNKMDVCREKHCAQFPCRRESTYHFMFETSHSMKETREFLWRQQTTLNARKQCVDNGEDEVDSRPVSPVSYKGSMDEDEWTCLSSEQPNQAIFLEHNSDLGQNVKSQTSHLTKKELFLKSTVQSKKMAVPKRIDINVNYGKPLPWRILLRPVRPTQTEPLQTSGKKILAF